MGLLYQIKGVNPTTQFFAYFGGFHSSFNGGNSIPGGKTFFVMSAEKTQSCYNYTNPVPTSLAPIKFYNPPYSSGTIGMTISMYENINKGEGDPGIFTKVYDDRH